MNHDHRLFAATLRRDLPTLDLHILKPYEALEHLELFLYRLVEHQETAGQVIYGIGKGVLHDKVIHYLQDCKLIDKIVEESGSCVVLLK